MTVLYRPWLLAACLSLAACQTAPVHLKLAHSPDERPGALAARTCHIKLLPVQDARSNRQTLGVAGNIPVLADDVSGWVQRGVTSGLRQAGHRLAGDGHNMQVAIRLAYLRSLPLRLHATVSLDVSMSRNGQVTYTRTHRAVGEKNNWANGEGEIMEVLNIALNNVVAEVATDIGSACR